jgi:PQQ-like domain
MTGAVEAKNCPNCGAALDAPPVANRITCRYCGHGFDLPAAPPPPARPPIVVNVPREVAREVNAVQRAVSSIIAFAVVMGVLAAVSGGVVASRGCSKVKVGALGDPLAALSAIPGMPNIPVASLIKADFLWDTVSGPPIPVASPSGPESFVGRIRKRPGDELWVASFEGAKLAQTWAVGPFGTYSQGYRSTFTSVVGRFVVVTDYRANIHSYDVATGKELHVLALSDRVKQMCGAPDGKPQVFIAQSDEKAAIYDASTGTATAAARPAWCPADQGVRNDCRGWLKRGSADARCRGPEVAPKVAGFEALNVLEDGDVAVALGKKKPGTAVPLAVGFDPATKAVRWQHPVPSGDLAAAAESTTTNVMDALSSGRFVSPYETTPRGWHYTAFDAKTGDRLWDIELQKVFGVDTPEGFALSPQRAYVMRTSSVEVYDAKSGSLLGTVGMP